MEDSLHIQEGVKHMMIKVVLKGPNYLLWSRTTRIAICGKGLWDHILEDKTPKDDEKKSDKDEATKKAEAKWFQEDQVVLGFLQNSLESSILEAYSYCESAKSLWDTLKKVYGDISNLNRVFEVKKALNELCQEELEFTKFLGKYQNLWSELDMLRPSTMDPKILNERREQDKIFGLLLNLNPSFNDLIKHILREDKLPSFEEVCSRIQKEQGSIGLFGGKGELVSANKGVYKHDGFKQEDRRTATCEHCKKKGHSKDKCWILHPHLKPNKFKDTRVANLSQEGGRGPASTSTQGGEVALSATVEYVKKSDLEDLIKAYASKLSGITLLSHKSAHNLVVDSGASHHMISNARLLKNIEPAGGRVIIANGDDIPIEGT